MRILAVGAHPDDLEVLCAGTLAKYRARGDDVFMYHAAYGDKGHLIIPSDELTRIRRAEAQAAADVIGATAMEGGFKDMEIVDTDAARLKFIDLVRAAQPDVVITHFPHDYHTDHKAVSALMLEATFSASVPHVKTEYPAISKMPVVYFMDTLAGMHFQPTDYVDITPYIETKREMLAKHQSQLVWLKDHDNIDVLDMMLTQSKWRGFQCSVPYAEGFLRYQVWGRTAPGTQLP
jgi:LmbE family N-acetylglucosaminyl deacetylase